MAISLTIWLIFAGNFANGLKTVSHNRLCCKKFTFSEIQDGGPRHFEIHFNGRNYPFIIAYIRTKFGTASKSDVSRLCGRDGASS